MSWTATSDPTKGPELVFGLVGPVGTDLASVGSVLQDVLSQVDYKSELYRLSHLMHDIPQTPWSQLKDKGPFEEIVHSHMTAGDKLCKVLKRCDAVALLGVGAIREFRESTTRDAYRSIARFAHILRSLKRPAEVQTLRRIYGPTFFVIAAHAPKAKRLQNVATKIAESHFSNQIGEYMIGAEGLLKRDEAEFGDDFGQNVRDTFPLADIIIDSSDEPSMADSIGRFIELLFGNTFHTPTKDEQGIFCAQAAAMRSASLARQVGAALCREDGTVVGLGTNDVPKFGGGIYWCDDSTDGRDYHRGYDTSDRMRENLLADILERLQKNEWLATARKDVPVTQLVREALREGTPKEDVGDGEDLQVENPPIMKGAQFTSTIDFIRAVHAEMSAITDAARHGLSTKDCVLYTTTFPCHDCAKHIVATGIKRVVYVEPYSKSLVGELYSDSIGVDTELDCGDKVRFQPFVGIAPKRYAELFSLAGRSRKNNDGTVKAWRRSGSSPQLPEYTPYSAVARIVGEQIEFKKFKDEMQKRGLATPEESKQ